MSRKRWRISETSGGDLRRTTSELRAQLINL
jgi:hypothetical protein